MKAHFIVPVTIRKRFSLLHTIEDINFGLVRMYVTPYRIFWILRIYIRFGNALYRQIVGIPMGRNCAPLVADLFLFCYERDLLRNTLYALNSRLCFFVVLKRDLFVYRDDSLTS